MAGTDGNPLWHAASEGELDVVRRIIAEGGDTTVIAEEDREIWGVHARYPRFIQYFQYQQPSAVEVMQVPFLDVSERTADGSYDFVYAGVLYLVRTELTVFRFREYRDEPHAVTLLERSSAPTSNKRKHARWEVCASLPGDPAFYRAVICLVLQFHARRVHVMTTEPGNALQEVSLAAVPGLAAILEHPAG